LTYDANFPHYSLEFEYKGYKQKSAWAEFTIGEGVGDNENTKVFEKMAPFIDEWRLSGSGWNQIDWDVQTTNGDYLILCLPQKKSYSERGAIWAGPGLYIVFFDTWFHYSENANQRYMRPDASQIRCPFNVQHHFSLRLNSDNGQSVLSGDCFPTFTDNFWNPATFRNNYCTFWRESGTRTYIRNVKFNTMGGNGGNDNAPKALGLRAGVLLPTINKNYEILAPSLKFPVDQWIKISVRFSTSHTINVPEIMSEKSFKVWFTDFNGDPGQFDGKTSGDFVIRNVVVKQSDNLYCVVADEYPNHFVTGFGVDYKSSPIAMNMDLSKRTLTNIGGGQNNMLDGDVLYSEHSALNLIGTVYNDILVGDDRDNVLEGHDGGDSIDGKGGVNTVAYNGSTKEGVIVSLATGKGYKGHAKGDTLANIQNIIGSDFDDVIIGDSGDNVLTGLAGNNVIVTGGGKDVIFFGAGIDVAHIHQNQVSVNVFNFTPGQDSLFFLGADEAADFSTEDYNGPESTLVRVRSTGTRVVIQGVPKERITGDSLKFVNRAPGGESSCSDPAILINGRCMFNAPFGFVQKNG
jgi:hypothetical protein